MQRKLANWIQAYLEYTKVLEAPDQFHFWSAVHCIAGALRGKAWFNMGYFQWKPNFFIIFVAPPGVVSKSTTINVATRLLREVPGIHFGPNSATWQALTQAFIDSGELVDISEDGGIQMSCISIEASELGTFLDPSNREMIDVLVDLWDGRDLPWKRATKGEGESEIHNPWLNFIGCTTPAWIEGNFPEYAIGGGFTSRTVFVYADAKRHYESYPTENMTPRFQNLWNDLLYDLLQIAQITGEYTLSADAKRWGVEWYQRHWTSKHEHLRMDRFGGYIARKQTHIHKLAMVVAAAQRNESCITYEDLKVSEAIVSQLEPTMNFVFHRISDSKEAKATKIILDNMVMERKIHRQMLWRKLIDTMSLEQFDGALISLARAGYITLIQNGKDYVIQVATDLPQQAAGTGAETSALLEDLRSPEPPSSASRSGSS